MQLSSWADYGLMATSFKPMSVDLPDGRQVVIHEAVRGHPAEFALGAYHDGELVGMVVCDPDQAPNGHLVIVVKPHWRGLGVGRSLLRRMAEWARDLGFSYLTLSYSVANQAASTMVASSNLVVARRLRNGVVRAALPVSEPAHVAEPTLAA